MEPREFWIEERLERYRKISLCNLGESGIRNITLGELLSSLDLSAEVLNSISLEDSPNRGDLVLREEIAKLYPGLNADRVLVTTGTGEALYILFHLLCKKDSVVSYLNPAFQALYEIPKMIGAVLESIPLLQNLEKNSSSFLSECSVYELFERGKDLVIFNHPHNPSGLSLGKNSIKAIQEAAFQYKGWILFDEHYRFLDFQNDLSWTGAGLTEHTVSTGSITKCFGVMGLRIGWMTGPKELIERARSFKDYLTHTVSPISEFLTLRILQNRERLIAPIKISILKNIQFFESYWKELPGLENFIKPGGGVVSFVKLKEGIDSSRYADLLLNRCGVFVLPGRDFECEGWIRIGFGETPERFQAGIKRWENLNL
ncbi:MULTISPECIES: pyridoxal phosphate-dependent aminotransferase [Leptospira]|uniref:Aminotransferase n=4 Tax=Leptospira borgpetersenii TaxID=174 RepID=M3HLG0_LEPBO|nr:MULTISPECIES: pyridoxal phosphate-dependent aminotransferase [Leptospira]EMF98940.1 aminotransferase, class I/II [Leptospira borgpetersenii str. 200701203]AXX15853.1 pyridoxal phosphate-dependent aminotransferase [Leptospira borgpetersenii serovar Ceylonica]EKP13959.1 aminotransferase, class I/II [Leptospira borgpetersenii str. 200801926]EKQ92862.1 aminotransferase, class I/II [Leptospira borgpetersenii str. UI 09149]EMK09816.1 aminotransferase, class I/II [Leptospira sp. serovar Kenya str.